MRNRFIHTTSKENTQNFQFRNRYFHSLQQTQNQDLQSTLSGNNDMDIQDEDYMDFKYDNELNKSSEDESNEKHDEESSDEETGKETETDEEIDEETDEEETDNNYEEEEEEEEEEETDNDNNEEKEEIDDDYNEEEEEETDDDNNEEEEEIDDDDNEEEEKEKQDYNHIVDEPLDKDKMPFYNNENEFAPYFENFTTAALFCWLQKHKISTSAYEDLAKIIHDPQFVTTHVIKNVRRIRTWRKHLPLLPISEKNISISSRKTPSTSKDSKMAYQLSINDIIWHVLNNPSLMKHMYFGPGIDSEIKSEYWHGTLWGESPFYGLEKLTISQG